MGITHEWNGSVLTITSDSGTSSMDLQGPKGDKGCRGPQGRCGILLDPNGNLDMTGYATETYVQEAIADVTGTDLSEYATKTYVAQEIAKVEVGDIDLTGYATEDYVDTKISEIEVSGGDVDLSNYYTKAQTESYVAQKINEAELSGGGGTGEGIDLSIYALKTDIPTVPTKVSAFTNDANYATKTYVTGLGYQTAAQVQTAINNALGVIENGTY